MPAKKVTPRGKAASGPKASPRATGKKQASAPKKRGSTRRYIRSIYSPAGGTRISLANGSRFILSPRGQIGDCAPVTKEDMLDPNYVSNKGAIFEEISAAEAQSIIEKQATNAQAPRQHSTMSQLTNAKGENYVQNNPTVEQSFESQGVTVARIEDGPEGRFTDGHQGLITREAGGAPEQVHPPGSPQNSGPQVPADVPPEQRADWLARNAEIDAHGALRSSIAPPQREITPTDY